jgi:hypothetical protein
VSIALLWILVLFGTLAFIQVRFLSLSLSFIFFQTKESFFLIVGLCYGMGVYL